MCAGAPLTVLLIPPLRRALLSDRILALLVKAGLLPSISDTEREAIDAGTVWLDGEWFSGRPSLRRVAAADYPDLTDLEHDPLAVAGARVAARVISEAETSGRRRKPVASSA